LQCLTFRKDAEAVRLKIYLGAFAESLGKSGIGLGHWNRKERLDACCGVCAAKRTIE
jgi:hypothetical protein